MEKVKTNSATISATPVRGVPTFDITTQGAMRRVQVWIYYDKRTFEWSMSYPERPPEQPRWGRIKTLMRKLHLTRASKDQSRNGGLE